MKRTALATAALALAAAAALGAASPASAHTATSCGHRDHAHAGYLVDYAGSKNDNGRHLHKVRKIESSMWSWLVGSTTTTYWVPCPKH